MTVLTRRQRSDYTFKYNRDVGRHGWLRLTPAYSVKLVEDILQGTDRQLSVLDPFSGTATTPLCSAYHGYSAVGYELNPFLVWLGRAKLRKYSLSSIQTVNAHVANILNQLKSRKAPAVDPPPLHNIKRWWYPDRLDFLCRLMGCIHKTCPQPSADKDLLLIAFCRVMIGLSNAAFNHQSMSFKNTNNGGQAELFVLESDYSVQFAEEMSKVIQGAEANPSGSGEIVYGDSRDLLRIAGRTFDLMITSPPYPNRMSYVRELRPYMYWLGYLNRAREAGELDWKAIGGTWGIATSRLKEWEPSSDTFRPSYFNKIIKTIATSDGKNAELLSRYVAKYFEDIWLHLISLRKLIKKEGWIHYIVGNSVFYGTVVPVEQVYNDMLIELGFRNVQVRQIRKRNSKKALFEFDVCAKK